MRRQYDFSKARRNPYAKRITRQVTIRLDPSTIDYFKELSVECEIPYQTLINLYLRDCATSRRRLSMDWAGKNRARRPRASPARRRDG